jgi:hypothetical protein
MPYGCDFISTDSLKELINQCQSGTELDLLRRLSSVTSIGNKGLLRVYFLRLTYDKFVPYS